jgi:hypothetical protein
MESNNSTKAPAKVSENPLDYASYMVYLRRGLPACDRLWSLCAAHDDVIVQDVDRLEVARPDWLVGVPTVVRLADYNITCGTDAVQCLETHFASKISGVASSVMAVPIQTSAAFEPPAAVQSSGAAVALRDVFGGASGTETAPAQSQSSYRSLPVEGDERYRDRAPQKISQVSLEDMIKLRQGNAATLPAM